MPDSYTVRLCSEKAAYEIRPKKRVTVTLESIAEGVAELTGMRIRVVLPAILILEGEDGRGITLFPDGRILLRGYASESEAQQVAGRIVPLVYT
ncbi:MAG: hypothetical protein ACTSUH_04670 [Candidatus Thorarchaeota archaeon]